MSQASLPTGVPGRIYPFQQLDTTSLGGYTLISILFTNRLNWQFVTSNSVASSEIFAYFPQVLENALDITSDQVKEFALQVYVPSSYKGPADVAQLGTMFLAYVPSGNVSTLSQMMKAKQSAFYTGVSGIAGELAGQVDSGFALDSVPDPNAGSDGASNSNNSSTNSGSSKVREDAIIGVVSALGAIAVLVLGFLGWRAYQRNQELAHQRLADPQQFQGLPPQEGHEFDRDSLGGQRRRSFYYAEDSLRGFQGERQEEPEYDSRVSPNGMRERRPVAPAAISAPILQQSSMNW